MTRDFTLLAAALLGVVLPVCPGRPNLPPGEPRCSSVSGEREGVVDSFHYFSSFYPGDPDGDDVAIRFDWGDGDTSSWSHFIPGPPWGSPPAPAVDSHSWARPGAVHVRAQAKDEHEAVSGWSAGYHFVVVPRRVDSVNKRE